MKDKTARKLEKQVLAILDDWTPCLGLEPYEKKVEFFQTKKTFRKGSRSLVAARVWCDWRYQTLYIEFCLPALRGMSFNGLERTVVHELVHALVNPMKAKGRQGDEEFTVTNLTHAFIWTRNRARGSHGATS